MYKTIQIYLLQNVKAKILLCVVMLFGCVHLHAQKVGIVLSGGGARAFAHVGVLKALEENNIPIDYITGTSGGALVGSMYACGLTPAQIEQIVLSFEFQNAGKGIFDEDLIYYFLKHDDDASWVYLKIGYDSILTARVQPSIVNSAAVDFGLMERYANAIALASYNFDSLVVPFRCLSSDIRTKKSMIFKEGDLTQAIRASMAFPFYFSPVISDGMILIDGGMYNNFPADVMLSEFHPDIIIGSSAAGPIDIPYEDNIISQTKTMLVQATNYTVPRPQDILVSCTVQQIGVFDFDRSKEAIDSGYKATMAMMPLIKQRITRQANTTSLNITRKQFMQDAKPVLVDQIFVRGVTTEQAYYFIKTLKPQKEPIELKKLKQGYFKLVQDDNVKYIFPKLIFNDQTGYFDMIIEARRERDLRVDFGGNFSSRPVNEAFIGLQYNLLGKQSIILNSNFYFGKFYNSIDLNFKLIIPGKLSLYTQPFYTKSRWDYFRSSSSFFEDIKPSYLIKNEVKTGINIGFPARNRGKVILEGSYFELENDYYQTRNFTLKDTADKSQFNGITAQIKFERNALNRKMYASKGSYFSIAARAVQGDEVTYLGTTSSVRDTTTKFNQWMQARVTWDNYYMKLGPVRFGFYCELLLSNQQFFSNYTASILTAPTFEPTQESKTIFIDRYRSHNYLGIGSKHIWAISSSLDLRLEGYLFQPFQEILKGANDFKARYGVPFSKRYLSASSTLIYHTPLGPISLGVNYYAAEVKPFTFMFHFGYILFNKKALD